PRPRRRCRLLRTQAQPSGFSARSRWRRSVRPTRHWPRRTCRTAARAPRSLHAGIAARQPARAARTAFCRRARNRRRWQFANDGSGGAGTLGSRGPTQRENTSMTQELCDIGMIGLAVMGENLALNIESKGFKVAVYNRSTDKVDELLAGRGRGKRFVGTKTLAELVAALAKPRKIMMLVRAGQPVDELIEGLLPLLDRGDILIDGGNSLFTDTIRRTRLV